VQSFGELRYTYYSDSGVTHAMLAQTHGYELLLNTELAPQTKTFLEIN
jgi:hypothetical protein